MSIESEYQALMATPVDEIREDISFCPDIFQTEPWYNDFQMYIMRGVCRPLEDHILQVRKALKVMGMPTHIVGQGSETYLLPGEVRQTTREAKPCNSECAPHPASQHIPQPTHN